MEYRATARYEDKTYYGQFAGHDHAAVESVLGMLPADRNDHNVVLIVESVYSNATNVAYVTTASTYRHATT